MIRHKGLVALLLVVFSLFTGGVHGSAVLCVEANGRITLEDNDDLCCKESDISAAENPSGSNQIVPLSENGSCGSCFDLPLLINGAFRPVTQPERVKIPVPVLVPCPLMDSWFFCEPNGSEVFPSSSESSVTSLPKIRSVVLRF